jgi:hypothetical protein
MPIVIVTPVSRTPDGWTEIDENFADLMAFINDLDARVLAVSGDGVELLLNQFDRPGIVGPHSYYLKVESYEGGAEIDIGRYPAPNLLQGELDVSYAFGTFGGQKKRIQQPGDVTLDAASFTSGPLPKTIWAGVGSGGTAQLFDDNATPGILFLYSMTWDGFQLKDFKRLAHYLPAYSLFQMLTKRCREIAVFDPETQWTNALVAETRLPLHGSAGSNGISGLEESHEIVGGYVDIPRMAAGRWFAPVGGDTKVTLKFMLNGVRVNLEDIEIDAQGAADRIYFSADGDGLGSDRYVTESSEVTIEREAVGADVVSARGCTYGLFLRPILGVPIAKDPDSVDQV